MVVCRHTLARWLQHHDSALIQGGSLPSLRYGAQMMLENTRILSIGTSAQASARCLNPAASGAADES